MFKFRSQLFDNLLTLTHIGSRLIAGKTLAGATNRKTVVVKETTNLTNDQHILALIIASITAPRYRLQLWKLLLPIAQHMRLDRTQVAYLTYSEITFAWDWR